MTLVTPRLRKLGPSAGRRRGAGTNYAFIRRTFASERNAAVFDTPAAARSEMYCSTESGGFFDRNFSKLDALEIGGVDLAVLEGWMSCRGHIENDFALDTSD
jgi:hypothetical protein